MKDGKGRRERFKVGVGRKTRIHTVYKRVWFLVCTTKGKDVTREGVWSMPLKKNEKTKDEFRI